MHIKFILPRFHTNMFYPTKILIKNKFKISIDCAYRQKNENYSVVKSEIIEESLLTKFLKKNLSKNLNKMNKFYLPKISTYLRHFKRNLPDIVIIRPYNLFFFILIFIITKYYKKKLIIYNQIQLKNINFSKKILYWIFTNLLKIKIISPLFIEKIKKKNFFLLPFIYETSFKQKNRKFDFLLVGKLYPKKNFKLFLKALSLSKEKFYTKLVMEVSNNGHKKEFGDLLKLIKLYNLTKYIDYSINVDHKKIYKYYDNSKCFVLATDGDLAPVSIIEALSRGCYVLASDTCGTKNYIDIKNNGFIFKTNNVKSLINHIVKISKIFNKKINTYNYDETFFMNNFNKILKK